MTALLGPARLREKEKPAVPRVDRRRAAFFKTVRRRYGRFIDHAGSIAFGCDMQFAREALDDSGLERVMLSPSGPRGEHPNLTCYVAEVAGEHDGSTAQVDEQSNDRAPRPCATKRGGGG